MYMPLPSCSNQTLNSYKIISSSKYEIGFAITEIYVFLF